MKWSEEAKKRRCGKGNPNYIDGRSLDRKKYEKEYWSKKTEERRDKLRRWRKNNPEKDKEHLKKYRKTEKYTVAHRRDIMKRRKREQPILVTKEELKGLIKKSKHCYYCNKKIDNKFDIDHKTPLSCGGENKIENLVVSCVSCNRKKGTMTEEEFSQKY